MSDPADLSNLADIVLPPPISWWPPAPGWRILAAASLAGLAILLIAAIRRWRANAYRRAALAELDRLGPEADSASISAILKRTALVAYSREDVASLTGRAWLAFLDRGGGGAFSARGASLAQAASGGPTQDGEALLAAARRWVKRHEGRG